MSYKVLRFNLPEKNVESRMNELADDGWMLIELAYTGDGQFTGVFERETVPMESQDDD